MTPSFLYRDADEQLLLALAPQGITNLLSEHGQRGLDLLRTETDPGRLEVAGIPERTVEAWLKHVRSFNAQALRLRCAHEGMRILVPQDADWPIRLNHLGLYAPRLLFVRGTIPTQSSVAIIGTRRPTEYGLNVTNALVRDLAPSGRCVVSGLAYGIDGRAHLRALEHNLPTIAVLGTNVCDREITPPPHVSLARRIIEHGGALISEVPPGAERHAGIYPARNRLIAALCQALIVVEANQRSGTLISARVAVELGRDVLAVPGSIFSPPSVGTHELIASGAKPYTKIEDLWTALRIDPPTGMEQARLKLSLSAEERRIIDRLRQETDGLSPTQLTDALGLESTSTISRLGMLELQGLVKQGLNGNWLAVG